MDFITKYFLQRQLLNKLRNSLFFLRQKGKLSPTQLIKITSVIFYKLR